MYYAKKALETDNLQDSQNNLFLAESDYSKALRSSTRRWRFINVYAGHVWAYLLSFLSLIILFPMGAEDLRHYLFYSLALGSTGAIIHAVLSLHIIVTRGTYRESWTPYFILLPFVGAIIGLIAYILGIYVISPFVNSILIDIPYPILLASFIGGLSVDWRSIAKAVNYSYNKLKNLGEEKYYPYGKGVLILGSLIYTISSISTLLVETYSQLFLGLTIAGSFLIVIGEYSVYKIATHKKTIKLKTDTLSLGEGVAEHHVHNISTSSESRKVEEGFITSQKDSIKTEKAKRSQKIKDFVQWSKKEVKEDPEWLISRISDTFIIQILETIKPYYATLFLRDIQTRVEDIIKNSGYYKEDDGLYLLFDLNFKLDPVEFHSELGKLFNGIQESSARLIFKAYTTVRIEDLKAHFSPAGIKIDTGRIEASTRLSLSRISISKASVTYISKLIELDISSEKQFEIKNLFLSSGIIDTLILLVEHPHSDRKKIHNINDPLLINNEYGLAIKVVGAYRDYFENLEKKVIELEEGFKVSIIGESFEIKSLTDQVVHLTYKEEDSKINNRIHPIFSIKPLQVGDQTLRIIFYYKLQLLQVLSTTLRVREIPQEIPEQFTIRLKENYLPTTILLSDQTQLEDMLKINKEKYE